MNTITILHLSDLHFKKNEKEENKTIRQQIAERMIEAIQTHVQEHNSPPDFVAITGDIAFSGQEYDEAAAFCSELRSRLPDTTRFLIVPGNHDVDRTQVNKFFRLRQIVTENKTDQFLEDQKMITQFINTKFAHFKKFTAQFHPDLYENENDYFWVKNYPDQNVSFLGLNSAWACEDDQDRHNITLGYPQVIAALKKADTPHKIALMHHPLFGWWPPQEESRICGELTSQCGLILHGHMHADSAEQRRTPSDSFICLGSNASYTKDRSGFIGFQFVTVHVQEKGMGVTVYPYILESREKISFAPDRNRYREQKGKPNFKLGVSRRKAKTALQGCTTKPLAIPEDYKEWIRKFHSTMAIEHLAKKGEVIRIALPELFIPLETTNPFFRPQEERDSQKDAKKPKVHPDGAGDDEAGREPPTIDIEELLSRRGCLLLRGMAGMGKTTLIKHLAYTTTQEVCIPGMPGYLPVLIFFKDLWPIYEERRRTKRRKPTFESLLPSYLADIKCPLDISVIENFMAAGRALFLCDGLDEIPKSFLQDLVDILAEFQFAQRRNRFLITGRPHGIEGRAAERFTEFLCDIEYLNPEKIKTFIDKWFIAVSGRFANTMDTTATGMISDIEQNEHVGVFTQIPLLLTAVCILYMDGKRIPEQRADLYDRIVENLLYKRFHDPANIEAVNLVREYLMVLAFEMQTRHKKTIEAIDAKDLLKKIFPQHDTEEPVDYKKRLECLFDDLEPNCGLLNRLSSGDLEFFHLTFQEFLAAKHIIDRDLDFRAFLPDSWWEETLQLYAGRMNLETKTRSNAVVTEIIEGDHGVENQSRLWRLGARCLRDFQLTKRDEETVKTACAKLFLLIESEAEVMERFEAGELLGALGDERLAGETMIQVPEGEFIRGSNRYDDEKPQRRIYLDSFLIGRYPVTNEEFRKFFADGGYSYKEFWSEEGWQWKEAEQIKEPLYWCDRKWNGPNFPVVGVSWYEAVAYAQWLGKIKGCEFRLPTEAEWEKTARGPDGHEYPWGEKFKAGYCNSGETGMQRTSPVGIFHQGKSHYGCFDLAGNVWEWCADWYGSDYYKKCPSANPPGPPTGSDRVIRGGGWSGAAIDCRSANRFFYRPVNRARYLGFRLVRSLS